MHHSATPCAVERKNEGNARRDERARKRTDANRDRPRPKHEWDGMSDGDDRNTRSRNR